MRIFPSKAAIMEFFLLFHPNFKHQRRWILWCHIVLTTLAILLLGAFLNKIYEVPVNYAEFHVVHAGLLADGDLHFFLIRDYDRNKESSDDFLRSQKSYKGGIYVEGVFFNKDSSALHTNAINKAKEDAWRKRNGEILDTAHYLNKIGNAVYVMIKGTRRQTMVIEDENYEHSHEYINYTWKDTTDYYHYGVFDSVSYERDSLGQFIISVAANKLRNKYCQKNIWKIPVDTLFYYNRLRANKSGFCRELHLYSSFKDTAIPVFTSVTGDPFEKPNPLIVAEDISKMVEIVKIPISSSQYIKSITIDYRCPTEFYTIVPEPDEKTMSSIRYTDKQKILKIACDGLKYHVNFPDMNNVQEVRIFALTTLITILFTLLLSLLYKLISKFFFKVWRKFPFSFIVFIINLALIVGCLIYLIQSRTSVNNNDLDFDTLDNGIEWIK